MAMRVLLITLRRRPGSDEISRRETVLEGEELHIGRGIAMEITLPEIDIDYHHASVVPSGNFLKIVALGTNGVLVSGREEREAELRPGVEAVIGRYKFRAEPGRDEADHVLIMEQEPEPVATGTRRGRDPRELREVLPSRRRLAWLCALAVLAVLVVWPMSDVLQRPAPAKDTVRIAPMARQNPAGSTPMEAAWSSGPLSRVHSLIGGDCGTCHQRPFERTPNGACLACHAAVSNHGDPAEHPEAGFGERRCASCHKEHDGGVRPVHVASTTCIRCHAAIERVSPQSKLPPVTDFGRIHPRFRVAVVQGVKPDPETGGFRPVLRRIAFSDARGLSERSGLKFSHAEHLTAKGLNAPDGRRQLGCADCHVPDPGGALMTPVRFEPHCGGCHKMTFDAAGVERTLPHANAAEVQRILTDYFRARALEGGVTMETAPSELRRRRLPGSSLSDEEREVALEWADDEAERQMEAVFDDRLCGACHEVERVVEDNARVTWQAAPALLQRQWMPRARFSHEPHEGMDCTGCHRATESQSADEVLMPGIETCRTCHKESGAGAAATCTVCHDYHNPDAGPISPDHAALFHARRERRQKAPADPGEGG